MKDIYLVFISVVCIILSALFGHYYPPIGIELTPVILIITGVIVFNNLKFQNVFLKVLLFFSFVALNDLLIKLYAGGRHDYEGLAWTKLFLYIGLLPSYFILVKAIWLDRFAGQTSKIVSILVFPILVVIYLAISRDLGLGTEY